MGIWELGKCYLSFALSYLSNLGYACFPLEWDIPALYWAFLLFIWETKAQIIVTDSIFRQQSAVSRQKIQVE